MVPVLLPSPQVGLLGAGMRAEAALLCITGSVTEKELAFMLNKRMQLDSFITCAFCTTTAEQLYCTLVDERQAWLPTVMDGNGIILFIATKCAKVW